MSGARGVLQWNSQVALVTGAASGLGLQLARVLAADGIAVGGIDIQGDALGAVEQEMRAAGWRFAGQVADVTDAAALHAAVKALENQLGPTDLLIANAGIGCMTSALSFDAGEFGRLIQVNLLGVANSVAAVLPGMLARGRGHLAAISSLASYRGLPRMAAYCASKSGVNALMEAIRVEVGPRGIHTTIVCPGWIRTPMTDQLRANLKNLLEVEHAAAQIIRALRQRRTFVAFPGGTRRVVSLLRWLPPGISDWLTRRFARPVLKDQPV